MRTAGLDIGSRSIELVSVDVSSGVAFLSLEAETTPDVAAVCRTMIDRASFDRLIVTGYGRALAEVAFGFPSVTEIKAYARGAQALFPGCRTILDIRGQDTADRAVNFEMNDRCAAGTGRFLEMTAKALQYEISEFGEAGLSGTAEVQISSMCAVFAESEVVGLLTRGTRRQDIAWAVHRAIAAGSGSMLARVGIRPPLVFTSGGARNRCLARLIGGLVKSELSIPPQPHMLGALGAALIAANQIRAEGYSAGAPHTSGSA